MRVAAGWLAVFVASLSLLQAAPGLAATPDPGELAAPDPTVLRGQLPNGLRYAVKTNAKPSSAISVRFYIETGSQQETDDQRGIAHFLEHMAFEGGRAIPGDSLSTQFQQAGISIERDHNAFTTLFGTYYVMDLQEVSDGKLNLALTWLRDVADGLTIDPQAVDRQRGVVTSEYFARRDGGTAVGESIKRFFEPELIDVSRSPGGTPESLKAATADKIRAYYRKWYRPDRAFVIMVGDMPVEALKARIEAAFGSWKADGPPPADPDPGRLDYARKSAYFAIHTPNFAEGVIEICRASPADPHLPPGVAAWTRTISDVGWMLPLQQRLDHLARAPDAPFLNARVDRSEQHKRFSQTCIISTPKADRWRDAVTLLSDEVRRLELHGVTKVEFDRAVTVITARIDALAASTRTSPQIAQGLIQPLLDRDVATDGATLQKLLATARRSLSPADANAMFANRWSKASEPLLAMVSLSPATPADLQSVWLAAQARPDPGPPPNDTADAWAYGDFGPPGKVVERQEISDPSFLRLSFENGVRANIKTLPSEHDRVEIRVRVGGGQLELKPSDLAVAFIGAPVLISGGLGKHDDEALSRIMEAHAAAVRFTMERDHFTLSGSSRTGDAALVAQALAAYLTDPGFRPESDRRVPQSVHSFYTNNRVSPVAVAQKALRDALPGPSVFSLPPEWEAAAFKATDFARVLKPGLLRDPIEVTIVGDISEAEAARIVSTTFGALAARTGPARPSNPDAVRLRFPPAAPPTITARHIGLGDKAVVLASWPMFPWSPDRQREVRALTLLREVLSDRVRRIIREKLGQTYTPEVGYTAERGGDDSTMTVVVETNPTLAAQVADGVRGIGRDLGRGDVTAAELERIRKPLLDDTAHRRETGGWWLTTLDGSYDDPYKLAQARTWQADYSSISVGEVNAVARAWLSRDPFVVLSLPQGVDPAVSKATKPVGY